MQALESNHDIRLAIICCVHGNEVFGKKVFDHYKERLQDTPGLRLVLANEEAFKLGIRYIDNDLNTSFPGNPRGNHEQRLAHKILPLISNIEFVLDIHTTSSDLQMVPIICNLGLGVRRILNSNSRPTIAYMKGKLPKPSLIGNVKSGVSLEFGENYATKAAALDEIISMVNNLLYGKKIAPKSRHIFSFTKTIPKNIVLDKPTANFKKQPTLGFYPFLFDEKSNENDQGFCGVSYVRRVL